MGHHALEITLQGHLFHESPASIGIPLQAERALKHPFSPSQSSGRIDLQGALQGLPPLRQLQHWLHTAVQKGGQVPHREIRRNRSTRRCPDLPISRVSHFGGHAQGPPTQRHPLR